MYIPRYIFQSLVLLLVSNLFFIAVNVAAEDSKSVAASKDYVRLLKDEKTNEAVALQTSIEVLGGVDTKGAFTVDLVSAVHIAELDYYKELNKRFSTYDSVLFELIADESFNPDMLTEHHSDNPLSLSQKALQSILGLSFQLDQINYRAPNFVHADMSPQQFSESMAQRGESISSMLLKVMLQSMANSGDRPPPDLSDLLMMGFSQYRTIGFRRSLARQFSDMETMLSAINGPEGSTIISDRNKVAVSVAKDRLQAGKRKLAIFYGGAHMPNMKEQLHSALGVEHKGLEWLTAWNLMVNSK